MLENEKGILIEFELTELEQVVAPDLVFDCICCILCDIEPSKPPTM